MAAVVPVVTIYSLFDPDTGEDRYVGKAVNLAARVRSHIFEKNDPRFHTYKVNWLRSLGDKKPGIRILQTVPQDSWEEMERHWIQVLKALGARLTNFADGGQTSPVEGKGHSEATKVKLREKMLARGCKPPSRKGQPVSDEARQHMRESALQRGVRPPVMGGWNKGRKATPEEVEKNRLGHVGKPWSAARIAAQERRKTIKESVL